MIIQPAHFTRPRGFSNGILREGRLLAIAGQIGWNERAEIVSDDFVLQFAQAIDNVIAVVVAAGGAASDIVQMTVFVTSIDDYRNAGAALGDAWRARMGKHYPTMALIGTSGLLEPRARVEITAFAVLAPLAEPSAGHP